MSTAREALRRLIRERWQYIALDPASPARIPGALGVADAPGASLPEVVSLLLESGLWVSDQSTGLIYPSVDLADYLDGLGDLMPWGEGFEQHIIGTASAGAETCTGEVAAPTWAGVELSAGAYVPAVPIGTIEDGEHPRGYRGLGQLLAQCRLGSRQRMSALRPSSWPALSGDYYSLLELDDAGTPRWWLIYAGPSGCLATELSVAPLGQCSAEALPGLSGDVAMRHRAWVLAHLALPESPTTLELLSAAQMAAVYEDDDGQFASPLVNGWRWNLLGTEGRIIVLSSSPAGVDSYIRVREYSLSLSLSGGEPSASLAPGQNAQWVPERTPTVWYPQGDGLVGMSTPAPRALSDDGVRVLVDYADDSPQYVEVSAGSEPEILAANSGGKEYRTLGTCSGKTEVSFDFAGTKILRPGSAVVFGVSVGGGTYYKGSGKRYRRMLGSSGSQAIASTVNNTFRVAVADWDVPVCDTTIEALALEARMSVGGTGNYGINQVMASVVTGTLIEEEYSWGDSADGGAAVVICGDGVCYAVEGQWYGDGATTTGSRRERAPTTTSGLSPRATEQALSSDCVESFTLQWRINMPNPDPDIDVITGPHGSGYGECQVGGPTCALVAQPVESWTNRVEDRSEVYTARLCTPAQSLPVLEDWTAWRVYLSAAPDEIRYGLAANGWSSYGGRLVAAAGVPAPAVDELVSSGWSAEGEAALSGAGGGVVLGYE
jgi:hypothetical protein